MTLASLQPEVAGCDGAKHAPSYSYNVNSFLLEVPGALAARSLHRSVAYPPPRPPRVRRHGLIM